jgi:hypothetical protein
MRHILLPNTQTSDLARAILCFVRPVLTTHMNNYSKHAYSSFQCCWTQSLHLQDIFGRAIQRYIRKPDKKHLLLCLLDWMTGQGYSVDSSSRNLLLKNAQLFGPKQLIAEILSKQQTASRIIGQRHKIWLRKDLAYIICSYPPKDLQ